MPSFGRARAGLIAALLATATYHPTHALNVEKPPKARRRKFKGHQKNKRNGKRH